MATEYCVALAAKGLLQGGRKVALVRDAIETRGRAVSGTVVADLQASGARLVTNDEALSQLAAVHS